MCYCCCCVRSDNFRNRSKPRINFRLIAFSININFPLTNLSIKNLRFTKSSNHMWRQWLQLDLMLTQTWNSRCHGRCLDYVRSYGNTRLKWFICREILENLDLDCDENSKQKMINFWILLHNRYTPDVFACGAPLFSIMFYFKIHFLHYFGYFSQFLELSLKMSKQHRFGVVPFKLILYHSKTTVRSLTVFWNDIQWNDYCRKKLYEQKKKIFSAIFYSIKAFNFDS